MGHVLVTGAAGFIGSHLCQALLRAGRRVRAVDAFTDTYDPDVKVDNVQCLLGQASFELVAADLLDADLPALLDGVDTVLHLAGEPGVATSWGQSFPTYVERNVLATHRLLEAVSDRRVGRLVYASSSSVYGPADGAVDERASLAPLSPYGASKLAAECLVGAYARERRVPAVSLRFFSVYGPRQRPDMAAHRFVEAALDGRPVPLFGSPDQARDFTYVDDVVAAVVAASVADVPVGTVLNVARGEPVPVTTLVDLISAELGRDVRVEWQPHRRGDTLRTHGDATAAKALLGWTPCTDVATGVSRQVAWQLGRRTAAAEGVSGSGRMPRQRFRRRPAQAAEVLPSEALAALGERSGGRSAADLPSSTSPEPA
ncbi:MAG: NAD-dependent epimerase/dehydratase family protein [Actinomycetes bacterium]